MPRVSWGPSPPPSPAPWPVGCAEGESASRPTTGRGAQHSRTRTVGIRLGPETQNNLTSNDCTGTRCTRYHLPRLPPTPPSPSDGSPSRAQTTRDSTRPTTPSRHFRVHVVDPPARPEGVWDRTDRLDPWTDSRTKTTRKVRPERTGDVGLPLDRRRVPVGSVVVGRVGKRSLENLGGKREGDPYVGGVLSWTGVRNVRVEDRGTVRTGP